MADKQITLAGWKSRASKSFPFYQCPDCGNCQEMLFGNGDGLYPCSRCGRRRTAEEFRESRRKRTVVECAGCGREVPLTPMNFALSGLGFICSSCQTYVAVLCGHQFVNPKEALDVAWNPTVCYRAEHLSNHGLRFLSCSTAKDFLVLKLLQVIVKEEDMRFLFACRKEQKAGLLLDCSKRSYLGFLVWTEDEHAVIRQIFILDEERRRGHAERMVKFWIERFAKRLNERFGIEAPNEKALNLHLKLGHIKLEGDSYVGVKCFFAPTM